jgi:hypothetical protein
MDDQTHAKIIPNFGFVHQKSILGTLCHFEHFNPENRHFSLKLFDEQKLIPFKRFDPEELIRFKYFIAEKLIHGRRLQSPLLFQ